MQFEDPLNPAQDFEVKDIASARYALKSANDYRFAVIHMHAQMEKELNRSRVENVFLKVAILAQYLPTEGPQGKTPLGMGIIPDPIPEEVPAEAIAALEQIDAQFETERARAEAELADNSAPLLELAEYLEELVKPWLKAQFGSEAAWLAGANSFTIGGCRVAFENGDVTFNYSELEYE